MQRVLTACIAGLLSTVGMAALAQDDAADIDAATKSAADDFDREGERCISVSSIKETYAPDDNTVLFYMRNGRVYLNELSYRCRGLERENRFMYQVTTNRLCNVDTITVLEGFGSSLRRGISCGLGEFVPVSEAEADFLRYGERSELLEEPEAVELPEPEGDAGAVPADSYGTSEYNGETDYNDEC